MKKHTLIYTGIALLALVLAVHFRFLWKERPQYVTLDIPMPRAEELLTYAGKNAMSEEFSTYVWNDPLGHRYFVHRMYVSVSLGEGGLNTENDVENYYNGWLKKLGWEETGSSLCDGQMAEFAPESYRAYVNPNVHHGWAVVCLATWPDFDTENYVEVFIKTINPSDNVASCDQAMPTTGFILLYLVSYVGRRHSRNNSM